MIFDFHLAQQIRPSDNFVDRSNTELGKNFPNFIRHRRKIIDQHFGLSVKARPELFVLRCDADGAGVEMALANIPATDRDECGCSKIVFFCSKHCCDHDVASGLHSPIGAQCDTAS